MVKDNIFVLLKSLSKSEKRQFKLYIGRLGANENAKFINLFGVLEKMDRYDELDVVSIEEALCEKLCVSSK